MVNLHNYICSIWVTWQGRDVEEALVLLVVGQGEESILCNYGDS